MKLIDKPLEERKLVIKTLLKELQEICKKYNIIIGGHECFIGDFKEKEEIIERFSISPIEIYARLRLNDKEEYDEENYLYTDFILETKQGE